MKKIFTKFTMILGVFLLLGATNANAINGYLADSNEWTITFGNDNTMQSGEIIDNVYVLTILKGEAGLVYVYPPEGDVRDVYYWVIPSSSTPVGGYSIVDKISGGEYDGAYPISLPLGEGQLYLFYVDSRNSDMASNSYNYKVEIGIPNSVEAIDVEEGEAVYYNLQGVRVMNPEHGIFVKVVNGKVSKVVL